MKRFKDMEVVGPDDKLLALVEKITAEAPPNWTRDAVAESRLVDLGGEGKESGFAFVRDAQDGCPKSGVFLARDAGRLYIPNIVPCESGQLSFDQYNSILDEFSVIVRANIDDGDGMSLNTTSDVTTITDWISPDAAALLNRFSVLANQSTGSSHPLDFNRWTEFLIKVHKEGASLDVDILIRWLIEEGGWHEDQASRLGIEYEFSMRLLTAYDSSL
ncbi:conserved hypothetical protein [uncultured Gammaproteobacteria bacterium]